MFAPLRVRLIQELMLASLREHLVLALWSVGLGLTLCWALPCQGVCFEADGSPLQLQAECLLISGPMSLCYSLFGLSGSSFQACQLLGGARSWWQMETSVRLRQTIFPGASTNSVLAPVMSYSQPSPAQEPLQDIRWSSPKLYIGGIALC